jgi:serine/threonine protein kinase
MKLYQKDKLIDEGTYGVVFKGYNVVTNDPVAIKMIKLDVMAPNNALD